MKKRILLTWFLNLLLAPIYSQSNISYDTIIYKLKRENNIVVTSGCSVGHKKGSAESRQEGKIITNQALNLFFANKISSFLSDGGDLSLFGSYATIGTEDNRMSLNYNFWPHKSVEGRIKRMSTVGIQADISEGFASIFSDNKFNSNIGISIKQTLLHRGVVKYDGCIHKQDKAKRIVANYSSKHKELMNIKRAVILAKLTEEIKEKAENFEKYLNAAELPNDQIKSYKEEFYKKLNNESNNDFTKLQYEALEETESYHQIRTSWSSVWVFIPISSQKFTIAPFYRTNFSEQSVYPWELNFMHSRIWESPKKGISYINISAGAFGNNNIKNDELTKINSNQYLIGTPAGVDSINLAEIKSNEIYIGKYKNFITPFLRLQYVWFPPNFFAGINISIEQNFGRHNPLNGKIGIPIRFKDSDGKPNINFELQLRTTDITGSVNSSKNLREKTAIGFNIGLPFSGFIY